MNHSTLNLNSRKSKWVLSILFAGIVLSFIAYDFVRSRGKESKSAPKWKQLDPIRTSSEMSLEETNAAPESHFGSLRRDNFKPFKLPTPSRSTADETKFEPTATLVPNQFEERGALIKFEASSSSFEGEAEQPKSISFPMGTLLYARLLTPIYSGSDETYRLLYGELTQPVELNGRRLLPSKTRFLGKVRVFEDGHARFQNEWHFYLQNGEQRVLKAQLQERDYEHKNGYFGFADGAPGLRMKPVNFAIEPELTKLEKLTEEILRAIARGRGGYDIARDLPDFDTDWPFDSSDGSISAGVKNAPEVEYFIPAATEFYLWVN